VEYALHCAQLLLEDDKGQLGTHLSNGMNPTSKRDLLANILKRDIFQLDTLLAFSFL
jgi:hypothetical protein